MINNLIKIFFFLHSTYLTKVKFIRVQIDYVKRINRFNYIQYSFNYSSKGLHVWN